RVFDAGGDDEENPAPPAPRPSKEEVAKLASDSATSASQACRVVEALLARGEIELASKSSVSSVEEAIADTLEDSAGRDWDSTARTLSARLLDLAGVNELFVDDAALAALLRETAPAQSVPSADPLLARARLLVHELV